VISNQQKEDPFLLEEVVKAAQKVVGTLSYDNVYAVETSSTHQMSSQNPLTNRRGPIVMPTG
jgi:hypothetical protein